MYQQLFYKLLVFCGFIQSVSRTMATRQPRLVLVD